MLRYLQKHVEEMIFSPSMRQDLIMIVVRESLTILIAYSLLSCLSLANLTAPYDPLPRSEVLVLLSDTNS